MTQPTALVIGAGLGGIATAARLARAGFQVTVLEKNAAPGGRCSQLRRDGHRFDLGPTLFLMPQVFAETYAALGERMEDHLDLRRIDPTYTIHFPDGANLRLTSALPELQAQVEALEPGAFQGLLEYLAQGGRHYRLALERFIGRNFDGLLDYFSPRNLPLLLQMRALVHHYDDTARYFKHPRLRAAFTFQDMYLGLSPYEAPATYSLLQYTELADGVWFPMGGLYRVVETLVAIAEGLGVRFRYNAPAAAIEVERDRATAVRLESGERLAGEVVVANADLPYVYRHLLPEDGNARRLERLKYTCGALTFYWGVRGTCAPLGHHNVFLADDYRASFDRIFVDLDLPEEPSFYIHAPARTDPAAAPPGDDSLMVLVPVGHLNERSPQDWHRLRQRARRAVLDRLARLGLPDLEQRLKFEVAYTPLEWKAAFNLERGAAFGLSHHFRQVGYLRPQNRHARYRNLYFVGASTHPGTGLPIVLLSARLTTERVLADLQGRSPQAGAAPNLLPSRAG